jgi:hypothetical protein
MRPGAYRCGAAEQNWPSKTGRAKLAEQFRRAKLAEQFRRAKLAEQKSAEQKQNCLASILPCGNLT